MELTIDNVNVFDASTADRVLAEYGSLLDEAELKDMYVQSALAEQNENSAVNSGMLLRRVQEYVRKLKSNFLELETKARFLDVLASSTDRESIDISDELLAETEIAVAHAKNKLKRTKKQQTEERAALDDTLQEVARAHTGYEDASALSRAKLQLLASQVQGLKAQLAAHKSLKDGDDADLEKVYETLDGMDEQGVRTLIDAEQQRHESHEQELEGLEAEVSRFEQQLSGNSQRLSALQEEVVQLHRSVEVKEGEDNRRAQLRELNRWYGRVDDFVSALTGVRVVDAFADRATLQLRASADDRSIELSITLDPTRSEVVSAELTPALIRLEPLLALRPTPQIFVSDVLAGLEGVFAPAKSASPKGTA